MANKKKKISVGEILRSRGFDLTEYNRAEGTYSVRCSQCVAAVVNGVAVHESGCPNSKKC